MIVRLATEKDRHSWQEFVSRHNSVHHAFDWRWRSIFPKVFSHEPVYILAENNGDTVGVCPLFLVRSLFSGSSLISVPYLNAGGILSNDPKITAEIAKFAYDTAKEKEVNFVELRYRDKDEDLRPLSPIQLSTKSHKVAMELALQSKAEEQFSLFPPKLRSQIRRPTKEGCIHTSVTGNLSTTKLLNEFYQVFSKNMRSLGTPVYPKSLFKETLKQFGKHSKLHLVHLKGKPLAAGITLSNNSSYVEIPWAASLREYSKCAPNMLLYWSIIKESCESGYEIFDFGRSSPDSGTFKFKSQWGANPVNLHWHYYLIEGEMPEVSPSNPKYELAISIWKKLPLKATTLLGPILSKSLP